VLAVVRVAGVEHLLLLENRGLWVHHEHLICSRALEATEARVVPADAALVLALALVSCQCTQWDESVGGFLLLRGSVVSRAGDGWLWAHASSALCMVFVPCVVHELVRELAGELQPVARLVQVEIVERVDRVAENDRQVVREEAGKKPSPSATSEIMVTQSPELTPHAAFSCLMG
jgi:hypothetical protein